MLRIHIFLEEQCLETPVRFWGIRKEPDISTLWWHTGFWGLKAIGCKHDKRTKMTKQAQISPLMMSYECTKRTLLTSQYLFPRLNEIIRFCRCLCHGQMINSAKTPGYQISSQASNYESRKSFGQEHTMNLKSFISWKDLQNK